MQSSSRRTVLPQKGVMLNQAQHNAFHTAPAGRQVLTRLSIVYGRASKTSDVQSISTVTPRQNAMWLAISAAAGSGNG